MASFMFNLSTSSVLLATLITILSFSDAANFNVRNSCPYTVWAAAFPGGGRRLDGGQTWSLEVPAGTSGARIWARTGCGFDAAGNGRCDTGDCGVGLNCRGYGQGPSTLAEFALNGYGNQDYIDISNIEGFNVPMEFASNSPGCSTAIRCTGDLVGQCPGPLRAPGGCKGPCPALGICGASDYSRFFKERCPDAYSFPEDDRTSKVVFTCPSPTNYRVVFCP